MNVRAKKSFGQHFLKDRSVLKKMIAAAELAEGETVLEVGPGTGVLTEALLEAGATVIAVEPDRDLVKLLKEKFADRIELIQANILTIPSYQLKAKSFKLISNIPYNITSALLEKFLTEEPRPSRMVLLVQKEVADRIVAVPPKMSILSVACQLYADVKRIAVIPPGAFSPRPKVDSAIVRLDLRPLARSEIEARERLMKLVKVGFRARRKQLHRNIADAGVAASPKTKETLQKLGLDPKARAEALTQENWRELEANLA